MDKNEQNLKTPRKENGAREDFYFYVFLILHMCTTEKYKNGTCVFLVNIKVLPGPGCTPTHKFKYFHHFLIIHNMLQEKKSFFQKH